MKKICALLIAALALLSLPAKAQNVEAYGILAASDDYPLLINHVVKFGLDAASGAEMSNVFTYSDYTTAAAWAEDTYYVAGSTRSGEVELPSNLMKFDLKANRFTVVGPLTGLNRFINDMTYDHSRGKMWAVARLSATDATSNSALYSINLNTGAATRIGTDLGRRLRTLACSYDGDLYGVDGTGMFVRIDPTDGTCTDVGRTDVLPTAFQSMEFDHSTGTLYWACTYLVTGELIQLQKSDLRTVNVATGFSSPVKSMGSNTQIVGFYIPYHASAKGTPAAVSGLQAVADPTGAQSVRLSWTNPTQLFGGGNLTSISKVEVHRDGKLVRTLTDVRPGAQSEITDATGADGTFAYQVTAYNAKGAGVPAEIEVYAGHDIPLAPGNVRLTVNASDDVTIAWDAPTAGVHGGWIDRNFTYDVVRMPDSKKIAENISALTARDSEVAQTGLYHYEVTARNADGSSNAASSESLTLGPEVTLPYIADFSEEGFGKWSIVDANNDDTTWIRERSTAWGRDLVRFTAPSTGEADDYLVLHTASFKKGATYKVTLEYVSYANDNKLSILLLNKGNVAYVAKRIADLPLDRTYSFLKKELTFTCEESQLGNFAIAIRNPASSSVMIGALSIDVIVPENLAALNLYGSSRPVAGKENKYRVEIENRGTNAVTGFTVRLLDQDNAQLASAKVTDGLASGARTSVPVAWNVPAGCKAVGIKAEVVLDGDAVDTDNITPTMAVEIAPVGSPDLLGIGVPIGNGNYHPFNVYDNRSAVLNIYQASEIGQPGGGLIRTLEWDYKSGFYEVTSVDTKVYLANTDRKNANDGWIPVSELTQVYAGNVSMIKGEGKIMLDLPVPFEYTGGNLAVVTVTAVTSSRPGVNFGYFESSEPGNTAYCYGDARYKEAFDFSAEGRSRTGVSAITLTMQTTGRHVGGKITDLRGTAIAGAEITVSQTGAKTTSDANGGYLLKYLPSGEYDLTVKAVGYTDTQRKVSVSDSDITMDIAMPSTARYRLQGTVLDSESRPLASARVIADGAERRSTVTDSQGHYEFKDILEERELKIIASREWMTAGSVTLDLLADAQADPIMLGYLDYAPANPEVTADGNAARISWQEPGAAVRLRYDSGRIGSQIGFNDSEIGSYAIGTAFRQPMRLNAVEWQTTAQGGPHYIVNLYIYDLDDDGEPTDRVLFSKRSVDNTDGEMMHFELPEPIDAPRGCLVALNYPGFLGLAIDDDSPEMPYREHTYYFTPDHDAAVFGSMDNAGLSANLLIRAEGDPYPMNWRDNAGGLPEVPSAQPAWRSYRVWREKTDGQTPQEPVLLTATDITDTEFTDYGLESMPFGVYRYRIASVNPDGTLSTAALTAGVLHNMKAQVRAAVRTASFSGNADGARADLTSADGKYGYTAVVSEDKIRFDDVWKGSYRLTVKLHGYEPVVKEIVLGADNQYDLGDITLPEIRKEATNLSVVRESEAGSGWLLRWNESGHISDDFESYADFEEAPRGEIDWRYVDADGAVTVGERQYDFPGRGTPHSFICFNPYATQPAMAPELESAIPHSGHKVLASFWGASVSGSDDWLISPELNYFSPVTFEVWARRRSENFGEVFRMGYSTTDDSSESFTWSSDFEPAASEWRKFSIEAPADVRYVAINAVSPDGFILMLDDLSISAGNDMPMRAGEYAPEVRYEVALDGKVLGTVEDQVMRLGNVGEGEHTATVTAVYGSGAAVAASVTFGTESGLDRIDHSLRGLYDPLTGTLRLPDGCVALRVLTPSGLSEISIAATGSPVSLQSLPAGVHIVLFTMADGRTVSTRIMK